MSQMLRILPSWRRLGPGPWYELRRFNQKGKHPLGSSTKGSQAILCQALRLYHLAPGYSVPTSLARMYAIEA